jgi:hypothetical protein
MELIEIDVIDAEPLQASVTGTHQMMTRQPGIVRARSHRKPRLGRQQHIAALAPDRLAHHLLSRSGRILVRGVEHVDTGVERDVDQACRVALVGIADEGELPLAAERHGAERNGGNLEAGPAKLAIFHRRDLFRCCGSVRRVRRYLMIPIFLRSILMKTATISTTPLMMF